MMVHHMKLGCDLFINGKIVILPNLVHKQLYALA